MMRGEDGRSRVLWDSDTAATTAAITKFLNFTISGEPGAKGIRE